MEALRKALDPWFCSNTIPDFWDFFGFFPNSGVCGDRVLVGFKENLSPLGLTPDCVLLWVNLVSSRDLACLRRHTSFLLKMTHSGSESDRFLVVLRAQTECGLCVSSRDLACLRRHAGFHQEMTLSGLVVYILP